VRGMRVLYLFYVLTLRNRFENRISRAMYEARKICNLLLSRYDARAFEITNLRINKLLFFIHAESLATKPNGLVRNHFEAWQFGPVVRPVFESFKRHGDQPISALATYLDYATGKEAPISFADIDPFDQELITEAFSRYSRFTTSQLVSLSHETCGHGMLRIMLT